MTKQLSKPRTVQVGRHARAMPAAQPLSQQERERHALSAQLDRVALLKKKQAEELAAKDAVIARLEAERLHDFLVVTASNRADEVKLGAQQKRKLIARVLSAHRSYRPKVVTDALGKCKPVPFNVQEVLAQLLDAIAHETQGAEGVVDVRKLSAQEYRAHLAKRGLQDPTITSGLV